MTDKILVVDNMIVDWGLGKIVVDGRVLTDEFWVSEEGPTVERLGGADDDGPYLVTVPVILCVESLDELGSSTLSFPPTREIAP